MSVSGSVSVRFFRVCVPVCVSMFDCPCPCARRQVCFFLLFSSPCAQPNSPPHHHQHHHTRRPSDRLHTLIGEACAAISSVSLHDIAQHLGGKGQGEGGTEADDAALRRAQLEVDECIRDSDFHAYTKAGDNEDFGIHFAPWRPEYEDALASMKRQAPPNN